MAGGCEGCVWCNMVVDEILETNDWEICHWYAFAMKLQLQDKRLKNPLTCFRHFLANSQKFTSHPSNNFKENHFPMQTPTHSFCGWRSKGKSSASSLKQPTQPPIHPSGVNLQEAEVTTQTQLFQPQLDFRSRYLGVFLSVDDRNVGSEKKKHPSKTFWVFGWISCVRFFWKTW